MEIGLKEKFSSRPVKEAYTVLVHIATLPCQFAADSIDIWPLSNCAACVVYTLHWQFAERMIDRRPNERP
jgi:hypothetical protein